MTNQFNPWQTFLDESGHLSPTERKLSLPVRFEMEQERLMRYPFKHESSRYERMKRLIVEIEWMRVGCPYYNIHPNLVGKLSKCTLDKIPVEQIELPGSYPAINVRFAEKHPDLQMWGALVGIHPPGSPLIYDPSTPDAAFEISVFTDFGERQKIAPDGFTANLSVSLTIGVKPGETVSELFGRLRKQEVPSDHPLAKIDVFQCVYNFFRLAVVMGFLVNADEERLCQHDVLSKDLRAYEDALSHNDTDREKVIVERAIRRGKLGWNVGTNEMFMGEVPISSPSHSCTGERELKWSHLRTGHPHAVRFGEGKRMVKIKWFRPTRVRSDLPFKAEE